MLDKKWRWGYFVGISMILIWLDFMTKQMAVKYLMNQEPVTLIKGVFEFRYLENRGAAFGIFQGGRIGFAVIAFVVMLGIVMMIRKIPNDSRYIPMFLCFILVFSGAVGNQIDRLVQGYVVDFLYFSLINFPIFNVADIYVSVTTFVMIYLLVFFYKDDELHFLGLKK